MFRTQHLPIGANIFMFSQVFQQIYVHKFSFLKRIYISLDTHQMSDYQQGSSYTVNAQ